jgi:flagellar hook assembly protein FlgD
VCDVRGAVIAILCDGKLGAGQQQFAWDGRDRRGDAACAGVYFVQIEAAGCRVQRRVAVLD